jgi:hypothetical protein
MAGLGLFNKKCARALAPRGLLQSAYDVFLCLVYAKRPRASRKRKGQGSLNPRSELHANFSFWLPSEALVTPFSIQKPSQKQKNLTSIGYPVTIQKPIFSVSNT